jgi:ATP-dependent Clp protease ATP-binding subunit ClpA
MFERFTDTARHVVTQAQKDARRLGHHYIGCEHLLLAAAATGEPASTVLRDHGVTPGRIEAEILCCGPTPGTITGTGHISPGSSGHLITTSRPSYRLTRQCSAGRSSAV